MIAPDATGDKPLFCTQSATGLGVQKIRQGFAKTPLKSPSEPPKALSLRRFGQAESRIR
jgi:hypothetical protein